MRRFTLDNHKHPTYQALAELGQATKTIFLGGFPESEALRQEVHEALNVVERWNGTNGFIFFCKDGEVATFCLDFVVQTPDLFHRFLAHSMARTRAEATATLW